MKRLLRLIAAVVIACGLTACPETTVNDDFGLKPAALKATDWNGAWTAVDDDVALQFAVADPAQGLVVMTEPDKKDDKPVEFKILRASADPKVKLSFALARERDEAVAAVIRARKLQGTVKPDKNGAHSHLDSTAADYAKLLERSFGTGRSRRA
jgi:hypothetical protein